MEIIGAQKAGEQYTFYPNGPDRQNSFVVVPREMVDDTEMKDIKANWTRMVAFGDLAELINNLVDDGVSLFKPGKGRVRRNDLKLDNGQVLKQHEIVAKTLDMKGFAKLMNSKDVKGTGVYHGPALPDAG